MTFASKTISEHLVRGVAGIAALVAAAACAPTHGLASVAFVAFALFALRGCPACWTIGLLETFAGRKTPSCTDGQCGREAK